MSEELKKNEMPPVGGRIRKPVDEAVQMQIGRRLRQQYNSVVEEDIPDRFLDLLDLLDRSAGAEQTSLRKQTK